MDTIQTLCQLARAAAPMATVRATVTVVSGGNTVATTLYRVELSGPDLLEAVTSQGYSPEAATDGLKRKYAKGRRQYAIKILLHECGNLAGGTLDDDTKAKWAEQLTAAQDMRTYERLAATCRTTAQRMGLQAV